LSYPMSAPVSRYFNQHRGFQSRLLPKLRHLHKNQELSNARVRGCHQSRVMHRKDPHSPRWTWDRSLFVGAHARMLTYSTATLRQRSTLRLQLRRILSQALLSRIIQASTHYPTACDLSRDLRCVHQITILRSTLPLHHRQHSYRLIFPSHLPCHYLKQLLCMPVRATRA
jgi:hypothetical protein